MTTEHRKAPRRTVESIERIGNWGSVKYHHKLECGHVEIRARASRAPKLGCAWCLRTASKALEIGAVTKRFEGPLDYDERMRENEIQVARLRGSLASALGVPAEAVDLVVTEKGADLIVESAVVYLSPRDIGRIANNAFRTVSDV